MTTLVYMDETGRVCRTEFRDARAAFCAVELLMFIEPARRLVAWFLKG